MARWTEHLNPDERVQLDRLDARETHIIALLDEVHTERAMIRDRAIRRMRRQKERP